MPFAIKLSIIAARRIGNAGRIDAHIGQHIVVLGEGRRDQSAPYYHVALYCRQGRTNKVKNILAAHWASARSQSLSKGPAYAKAIAALFSCT
jgi:hypothetical protein